MLVANPEIIFFVGKIGLENGHFGGFLYNLIRLECHCVRNLFFVGKITTKFVPKAFLITLHLSLLEPLHHLPSSVAYQTGK